MVFSSFLFYLSFPIPNHTDKSIFTEAFNWPHKTKSTSKEVENWKRGGGRRVEGGGKREEEGERREEE